MRILPSISLSALAMTALYAAPGSVGNARGGLPEPPVTDELVIYERGNMPVIVLAPHDGRRKPEGMPLRKRGIRDVSTSKLARRLCSELAYTDANGVQRRPHLVINLASRAVADPNMSWERNVKAGWFDAGGKRAEPPARAKRIHGDFHACAAYAVKSVEADHGAGVLVDLHGLSAKRSVDMYGYLVRGRELSAKEDGSRPTPDTALAKAIRERSSVRHAASRKKTDSEVASLVRGRQSLASLVDQAYSKLCPALTNAAGQPRGRPATPSARFPSPKESRTPDHDLVYFNGAYDIFAHSSRQNGVRVDSIQIETLPDARNTRAQRVRFAKCMATALREFLRLHYDLSIASPAKPAPGPAAPTP
ncbi:MAG: hypothetical protein HN380_16710 [Victivallales bacterium]|jgi:hypothetical protein|nr:hypothetical protein [Victivallales bacterium]